MPYQELFVFSVSMLSFETFTVKSFFVPKMDLTYAISIFYGNFFFFFEKKKILENICSALIHGF